MAETKRAFSYYKGEKPGADALNAPASIIAKYLNINSNDEITESVKIEIKIIHPIQHVRKNESG